MEEAGDQTVDGVLQYVQEQDVQQDVDDAEQKVKVRFFLLFSGGRMCVECVYLLV